MFQAKQYLKFFKMFLFEIKVFDHLTEFKQMTDI